MKSAELMFESDFPALHFIRRGKVRDIYEIGKNILIVATDRLSAYDVIMNQPIPSKGKVLTQISNFWFGLMKDIIPNHIVETDVDKFPAVCLQYRDQLAGRSILVKYAQPLPIECVARGYLSGSGWNEYCESGSVCGVKLPRGLMESSKLPQPIFTPATKAEVGHDENIDFARAVSIVGKEVAEQVRRYTLAIYTKACSIAEERGIIIADTKMEFGLLNGKLILIDELLTPDSSRFWPQTEYKPGRPQKSFDKQYVRDYLVSIGFKKKPPAPHLPEEIIQKTSALYLDAMKRLTGTNLRD